MLIVQSRVESSKLAEARARVCGPLGRTRNYLVSRRMSFKAREQRVICAANVNYSVTVRSHFFMRPDQRGDRTITEKCR
jgi:hypothetical protein